MSVKPNEGHDGFLSRWSRRKSESRDTAETTETTEKPLAEPDPDQQLQSDLQATLDKAEAAGQTGTALSETDPQTVAEQTPTEPLPDLDTLTPDSDFRPFMAGGVSKEIRNLALRKLFKAAVFGQRDGLDDYDEDFTSFEPLGDTVTADMRHHAERRERLAREAEQAEQDELAEAETTEADSISDEVTDQTAEAEPIEPIDESREIRHSLNPDDDNTAAVRTANAGPSRKLRRRPDDSDELTGNPSEHG